MNPHKPTRHTSRQVAVDLRMIEASGIGVYLQNLMPRVIAACPDIHFVLMGSSEVLATRPWAHQSNTGILPLEAPIYSIREQMALWRKIPREVDLFWSPHYNIPLTQPGRLMVTVHDVCHLALPQFTRGRHRKAYARFMFRAVRHRAGAILCVSEFTKRELSRLVGVSPDKVTVTHNGVDPEWFRIQARERPHPRPYLLYVGNVKPHKNLGVLLQAFDRIQNRVPHDLLLVGKKSGFITEDPDVPEKAASLGERVRFTGEVTGSEIKQYFVHAQALVFPSLYEGFGLPAVEAMACGCPVIASTAASLVEVCGPAALYFDPHNPVELADRIQTLVGDPGLGERLAAEGKARAELFSWDNSAKITSSVIYRLLG